MIVFDAVVIVVIVFDAVVVVVIVLVLYDRVTGI